MFTSAEKLCIYPQVNTDYFENTNFSIDLVNTVLNSLVFLDDIQFSKLNKSTRIYQRF